MRSGFAALCRKELLLLLRDRHGLLVLFAMPTVFILVMSLALRGALDARQAPAITIAIDDHDGAPLSQQFTDRVLAGGAFEPDIDAPMLRVVIEPGFSELLATRYDFADDYRSGEPEPRLLRIELSPTLPAQMRGAAQLMISQALIGVQTDYLLGEVMGRPEAELVRLRYLSDPAHLPVALSISSADGAPMPSAVQQSVPAWLIFALFFTVIPLATTFVIEREQGSLLRLRVLNVSGAMLFASKLAPYYLVNLVQTTLMLLVGVYVVPALGGDRLTLGTSPAGLLLIASATSVAAIALALLVAVNVRSVLQATAAGGTLCLLLGALGGIMVPKLIMPASMQALTVVSPMAWALEGYWDLLLRGGGASTVLPECAALLGFASVCLAIAGACYQVRNQQDT